MVLDQLLQFDLLNPWLLFVPVVVAFLLVLRSGGIIRLSGGEASPPESFRTKLRARIPDLLMLTALIAAGLGVAGLGDGNEKKVITTMLADRIIVTQDQSGSMFGVFVGGPPLHCVFKKEREAAEQRSVAPADQPLVTGDVREDLRLRLEWSTAWSLAQLPSSPKIDGSCRAIEALFDELDRRAVTQKDVTHQIAFSRFATTAVLHTPFTSDLRNAREAVSSMNWTAAFAEIGSATNFNEAVYLMFAASLRRHIEGDEGFTQIPAEAVNKLLGPVIGKPGRAEDVDGFFATYPGLLEKLRKELSDTTMVIITDGEEPATWYASPSMERMLYLARLFEMPVFMLSTEADDQRFRTLLALTGGEGRRGELFLLNKGEGYASMPDIMRTILDRSFARSETKTVVVRNSFAAWCAGVALFALLAAFFMRETAFGRTITG